MIKPEEGKTYKFAGEEAVFEGIGYGGNEKYFVFRYVEAVVNVRFQVVPKDRWYSESYQKYLQENP